MDKVIAIFDDDPIKMTSLRYQVFKKKGTKCVKCGIEGKFFAKERHRSETVYHFNLYGKTDQGYDILMTKDHIVPIAKGGKDTLDNFQIMCTRCNAKKADKLENI